MIKLVALWTEPDDTDAFVDDYALRHFPLARAMPGLRSAQAYRVIRGPFHWIAELCFDDLAQLDAARMSEVGLRLTEDARRLQDVHGNRLDVLLMEEAFTDSGARGNDATGLAGDGSI